MADVTYLTRSSLERLENRLAHLRKNVLPNLIKQVGEAASFGDLSENFEWQSAKQQRDMVRTEILKIENLLAHYQLIETLPVTGEAVTIGTKVSLLDLKTQDEVTYSILGSEDIDPKSNIISHTSPIARSLMMKEEGDIASVVTPSGTKQYEVVSIEKIF
ncbi:MAG: transcription elongation factor GreA [Candidatus Tectomicrobia bacterium]|nr:transcription elongation factor GreA [Candidatus Tectomicrobia bacterium]